MVTTMSDQLAAGTTPKDELTLEQWAAMPEDEPGELVDGRLEEEEMPDFVHELIVTWLAHAFRSWLGGRGGFVGGSGAKFAVAPRRGRKPDLSVYLPGGGRPPRRGVIRLPPDLVVEVLSPDDRPRQVMDKVGEYLEAGTRLVWVIAPRPGRATVYRSLTDVSDLRLPEGVLDGEDVVPGFRCPLSSILG